MGVSHPRGLLAPGCHRLSHPQRHPPAPSGSTRPELPGRLRRHLPFPGEVQGLGRVAVGTEEVRTGAPRQPGVRVAQSHTLEGPPSSGKYVTSPCHRTVSCGAVGRYSGWQCIGKKVPGRAERSLCLCYVLWDKSFSLPGSQFPRLKK